MRRKITRLLNTLGIRATLKGYRYLTYGLELCLDNEDYLLYVYRDLYVSIAEKFDTNRSAVEHCIRTAVARCWYTGNKSLLNKITGYELQQKPSNSEFIDILYCYLKGLV